MNDVAWLHPQLLLLAPVLVLLLVVGTLRLRAITRARRYSAMFLQAGSVLALLLGLAQPVALRPDTSLDLVVVLDASASVGNLARDGAVTFARNVATQAGNRDGDTVRFVVADRTASLATPEQIESGEWAAPSESEARATDLAAGLRLAGSLLGDAGRRRVILVSDGWETKGSAADEAARLSARGIEVAVRPLVALGEPEVVVEHLQTPQYARVGDNVLSDLQVYSSGPTTATLLVSVDGATPSTRRINLRTGTNNVTVEQRPTDEGFHRIEVTVQAGAADTSQQNNSATSTLVVKPQPRVLVLQDRDGEGGLLSRALQLWQMDVELNYAVAVPPKAEQLDAYDAVVLYNVAATSLTLDQQRTLQEYVRRSGHGLVVVGGETAFANGDYSDSTLEEMLPVSSQPPPRPQEGATALILVLDKSSSMSQMGPYGDVDKFDMAIQAAKLAVDALREGDTIGVIAFDDRYEWAVPVQGINSAADRDTVKNMIGSIEIGNVTSIFPAVDEAARTLRSINAPTRHLVLLTDGREQPIYDYGPLLARLRADNIDLSTIAIGSDSDTDLLTQLAREGRGRYYYTEQPQNIPRIVFKEIGMATRDAVVTGAVQPHLSAQSPVLRGIAPQDLPKLQGYNVTLGKGEAVTALTSDAGDPLLAHWQYGLGRVVAFTSSAGVGWGGDWPSWTDFGRFWNQAVRWSLGGPVNRLLQPSITYSDNPDAPSGGGTAHIVVESLNPDNTFADLADVTAGVRTPAGTVTSTLLLQTAPGRYEGDVPVGGPGGYEVLVRRTGGTGGTGESGGATTGSILSREAESETTGFAVPVGVEYLRAGVNDRLLQRINGGAPYIATVDAAMDLSKMPEEPRREPLWGWLLPLSLLLMLGSVAARRVEFGRRRS